MSNAPIRPPRAAFGKLLLNELRLAKRVPYSLILGLGMPILLLVIFGSIPALHQSQKALGGLSYFAISVPVLIGFSVVAVAFISLPSTLVTYREQGVLRRLSTTPVPPLWLLAAQVIINICVVVLGLALLVVIGMLAFGLSGPKDILGFLLGSLLTITSIFAIGIWLTALAHSNASSRAIGGLLLYVLLFFGGLWVPRAIMPPVLLHISDWTPLGAGVAAIQSSFQGTFPSLQALACLTAYTAVFSYLSVRYFRWE